MATRTTEKAKVYMTICMQTPFPYTLCLSNCGGAELYLPTREEIPFGGYEVQQFKYSKVFVLTENAECRIVAENQRLLAQLFSKRRR